MTRKLNRHTLQLSEILLSDLEVKRLTPQPPDSAAEAQTVTLEVSTSGEILTPTEGYAVLRVSVGFEEPASAPFSILVTYKGKIISTTPVEEAKLEAFLREEGLYLVWPYLRQLVSDLTIRMGFPPLFLPTLAHSKSLVEAGEDVHDDGESELRNN